MFKGLNNIPILGILLSLIPEKILGQGRSIHTIYLNVSRELDEKEAKETQQLVICDAEWFKEDFQNITIEISWTNSLN